MRKCGIALFPEIRTPRARHNSAFVSLARTRTFSNFGKWRAPGGNVRRLSDDVCFIRQSDAAYISHDAAIPPRTANLVGALL
jgi:hypothetical protein